MTISEILKENGLSEDVVKAILDAMKTNKIFTASEENLDIRYGKLRSDHDGLRKQYGEATKLIEEMKAAATGQDELQTKIAAYEQQVQQLQGELEKTKIAAAVKVHLLSSKANDVDYLSYKLNEKLNAAGESITLDENGAIKGWDDKLAALKTQYPRMFDALDSAGDGLRVVDPNKLKGGSNEGSGITREMFGRMGYKERAALAQEKPEIYAELAKS